jgi:alcohol dehydrogenase
MKAAQISQYGHADAIQIVDAEQPTPAAGQVLVEVYAASINPFDTSVREGNMQQMIPLQLPVTLGGDIAGRVVELGEGVDALAVGDTVYGQANVVAGSSGAFAEYAATAAGQIAKAPANVNCNEAAALPLVGVSALQALTEHIGLQSGQKIFIHGGAGGIGTVAIQIAKHLGAYVATTATGEGVAYVQSLGADQVIDYKSQDFADTLSDFDAVFDTVGGDDFAKSLAVLKQGGVAVSMIAPADESAAAERGVKAMTQMTRVTTDRLNALRELVEAGVVTPHVDKVFPLHDVQAAFQARESGAIKGKVVLEIKPDTAS